MQKCHVKIDIQNPISKKYNKQMWSEKQDPTIISKDPDPKFKMQKSPQNKSKNNIQRNIQRSRSKTQDPQK